MLIEGAVSFFAFGGVGLGCLAGDFDGTQGDCHKREKRQEHM